MTDSVELERAIEQLLFNKIASGRMVGFTVTVAHEIMGLIRNVGITAPAQGTIKSRSELAERAGRFQEGAKRIYDSKSDHGGDMWFFELFHFLGDVQGALAAQPPAAPVEKSGVMQAAENAAKVIEGWSDSKRACADRIVGTVAHPRLSDLRDYFAAKSIIAIAGLWRGNIGDFDNEAAERTAKAAYRMADAMLAARTGDHVSGVGESGK